MDTHIGDKIKEKLKKLIQDPKYGQRVVANMDPKPSEGISPQEAFERLARIGGTTKGVPADTPAPKLAMGLSKDNGLLYPSSPIQSSSITTPKNGEATTTEPVEKSAPQEGQDDLPRYMSSDWSKHPFMIRLAEIQAKVADMSQEEIEARFGRRSEGVGPAEAMRRLEEIENGLYNRDSGPEEDDKAENSGGEGGGKEGENRR